MYNTGTLVMATILKRIFKRYLRAKGLQITQTRFDLDSFFVSNAARTRLIGDTARVVGNYMEQQRVFPIAPSIDFKDTVEEFFTLYLANPAKASGGGCGFNSLLWIYALLRGFDPRLVVESGSYAGGSAWVMRRAAPGAEIHCFDPDLSRLVIRDDTITFHEHDWASFPFRNPDPTRSVCFFDDHCDQVSRLLEAHAFGFRYLIFDDNTPFNFLYLARSGVATLEFLFDHRLTTDESIEWSMLGNRVSYVPNIAQFNQARAVIKRYERVPCLHWTNGFAYMTPLTLVALHT